ncbi:peptidase S8/S53 domain-containing protein [Cladorrhinum sp. PSN259]|nr:peptidase S8/S53 domain-containing protein [Cladorrhinum sp. PSN259]
MAQGSQSSESISSQTFRFINKTIDERFKHTNKDLPVKIAILDTGLDNSHPDFEQARTKAFVGNQRNEANPVKGGMPQKMRFKEARNFCTDINQDDNHVQDLDGHGTAIAGTILRLVPRAHLCIARVSLTASDDVQVPESQKEYKKPRPDVVARAIRWAISLKVDILNLSLGFRDISLSQLSEVRDAPKKAQDSNIVVFAATSNAGAHQPIAWPANDAQYAIGIHSCNDSGTLRSSFTAPPSQNGTNFMVVGESILSQLTTSQGGGFRTWTGSSFATPVATAIGALILTYVRQKVLEQEKVEAESQLGAGGLDQLRTNAGMIKILKSFSTLTEGQYWSLSPKLFWGHQLYTPHSDPNRDAQEAKDHAWRMITKALGPSG